MHYDLNYYYGEFAITPIPAVFGTEPERLNGEAFVIYVAM